MSCCLQSSAAPVTLSSETTSNYFTAAKPTAPVVDLVDDSTPISIDTDILPAINADPVHNSQSVSVVDALLLLLCYYCYC